MEHLNLDSMYSNDPLTLTQAKEVYGDQGFTIVRSFLSESELSKLQKLSDQSSSELNLLLTGDPSKQDYHHFLAHYVYDRMPKKSGMEEFLIQIARRVFAVRNQIAIQPTSDRFLHEYCQRFRLDPCNGEDLTSHQLRHSYIRVALYRNGEGQKPHRDNPSELQCILPLTQVGVDYESGGLVLMYDDGREVFVDALVKPGDLVILNAYKIMHRVEPVKSLPQQKGRFHLFVPMIPDYHFAPLHVYYFSNSLKPVLATNMRFVEKVFYSMLHFVMWFLHPKYLAKDATHDTRKHMALFKTIYGK